MKFCTREKKNPKRNLNHERNCFLTIEKEMIESNPSDIFFKCKSQPLCRINKNKNIQKQQTKNEKPTCYNIDQMYFLVSIPHLYYLFQAQIK